MSTGDKDGGPEANRSENLDTPLFERGHQDSNRDDGRLVATVIATPQEPPAAAPGSQVTMGVPVGGVVPGHLMVTPMSSAEAIWLQQNQFMKSWLIKSVIAIVILFFTVFLSLGGPILATVGASIYTCPACRGHKSPTQSHVNTIKVLALVAGCIDMVISAAAFLAAIFALVKSNALLIVARAIITALILLIHGSFCFVVVKRMMFVGRHFNPVSSGVATV